MEMLKEILEILVNLVVIPTVIYVAKYFADALKEWIDGKIIETDNEIVAGYLTDITDIIYQAVICTNQTYVDSLKAQGKFDLEAQEIAFETTKDTVMALLSDEANLFITDMYGDIEMWLDTKIEQVVNEIKNNVFN